MGDRLDDIILRHAAAGEQIPPADGAAARLEAETAHQMPVATKPFSLPSQDNAEERRSTRLVLVTVVVMVVGLVLLALLR
jgi:hypothetical protein